MVGGGKSLSIDVGRLYPVYWKKIARLPENLKYEYVIDIFLADIMLICLHASQVDANLVARVHYYWKFMYPFISLMGVAPVISPGVVRSRRVPSLGGYTRTRGSIILLVGCFSGMVFGAIHCVGWNYFFQKHTEQVLWRVASLVILCVPISTPICYCFVVLKWSGKFYLGRLFSFVLLLASFAYIAARLTLIVFAFLSFQTLPPGVYDTVAWSKFILHL
jgi:hypothetical protein